MTGRFLLVITLFCNFISGCSNPESVSPGSSEQPRVDDYNLTVGSSETIGDLSKAVKGVRKIELSSEVAGQVGVLFHFVVIDSSDVILVDEISGKINRINGDGEIVWQIKANGDDFRYHTGISEFLYDSFHKQLVVYDEFETFVYNLSGQPVKKYPSMNFDYHQFVFASDVDRIYSIQGFQNIGLSDVPKQLVWTRNDTIQGFFVDALRRTPGSSLIGGFPEFSQFNNHLYYHATFRDTFYRLDPPVIVPDFTLRLSIPITTSDVMDMDRVKEKLTYVHENRIFKIYGVAADSETIATTYLRKGGDQYFAILDRMSNRWLLNNQYLRFQDYVFKAPILYHDGYFIRMFPQYQIDHYAKLKKDDDTVSPQWKEELQRLDTAYDELGPKTLYLIEL